MKRRLKIDNLSDEFDRLGAALAGPTDMDLLGGGWVAAAVDKRWTLEDAMLFARHNITSNNSLSCR